MFGAGLDFCVNYLRPDFSSLFIITLRKYSKNLDELKQVQLLNKAGYNIL